MALIKMEAATAAALASMSVAVRAADWSQQEINSRRG